MRFVNVLAILAMTGLGLTLFQNCSKSKFADANSELLEQASLSTNTIFINNDALYTNNTNVRVQVNLERPMMMYLTNDPSCASGGVWQEYSPEVPWVLGSKNKATNVYVKFKTDYNESACSTDDIVHDDIPPTISQLGSVAVITNAASVNVSLTASDSGSGVDKILCGSDVTSCGNAVTIANSTEGQKNNVFYSLDKAGNKSAPLAVSWLYDKTGPVISFGSKPGLKSKELQAMFTVLGQDNFSTAAELKYRRSLDGGAYADTSANFSVTVGEGDHTVMVEAFDKAGNKSNTISYTWTVGTKLPSLTFTKTPKAYDNQKGSFEFTGEDQFKAALVKFECSLNKTSFVSCSSPYSLASANLNVGPNSFSVRGYDSLGMMAEKEHVWVYDNVKPSVAFTKKPAAFSNKAAEDVQVSATEANLESIEFIVDGASVQKSLINNYLMSGLTEVKHSIRVVALDKAGNSSDPLDVNANYSFWSDFTAPVVSIGALAAYSKNTTQTFNVTATDNNSDAGNVLSYFYQLDSAGTFAQISVLPLQISNLTNGSHQILAYAVDKAGNKSVTVPSESIYVDLLAPVISIIKKPAENMATGSHSIINFTVNDVGSGLKPGSLLCSITVGTGAKTPVACSSGVDLSIFNDAKAAYLFEISVKDNLDWEATSKISWIADDMYIAHNTTFEVSKQVNSKVDIIFLVANDQSMTSVLSKIGGAFQNFQTKLQGLDWRIAITTTDTGGSNAGSSGQILKFANNAYYITPSTPDVNSLFQQRLDVGTNQSQKALKDKGLTAMHLFLDLALSPTATNEKSFMRSDAVLASVIVSHADEANPGSTLYSTSDLFLNGNDSGSLRGLYDKLPGKTYLNHSSIVLPDSSSSDPNSCINQSGSVARGLTYANVSRDTGGVSASICSTDYGSQFDTFGNAILTKVSQIQLDCAPVDVIDPVTGQSDGKLDIVISYKETSTSTPVVIPSGSYNVVNNVVRFVSSPNVTGAYSVDYQCLSWTK